MFLRLLTIPLVLTLLLPLTHSAPTVIADLPSALRLSTASDLPDLLSATPHTLTPETQSLLFNMGFYHPSDIVGQTVSHRLVLPSPRYHHLAYTIPSPSHPYSEYLVAIHNGQEGSSGKVQSYGWARGSRWDPRAKRDIAIKLGDGRYLLADSVPIGGFSITRAPWTVEGSGWSEQDYTKLGGEHEAEVRRRF